MKNRFIRQRSEELRRKINKESQNTIRRASSRVQEEPSFNRQQNGMPNTADFPNESITGAIKKRFKLGWRVLSLLIVGVLTYILNVAWQSPQYRVSEIKVEGLQRLAESEVLSNLNVIGVHCFAVVPEQIQEQLLSSFPEFRQVKVSISNPTSLEIQVVERQPMISWQMNNSQFWIDTEGYLIPPRGTANETLEIQADSAPAYHLKSKIDDPGTVNVIRDKPFFKANPAQLAFFALPKQVNDSLLTAILQLYAWMPNEKSLLYQKQRGLGWKDARGWDVFVGQKLEGINDKMVMYETIVRELEKQGVVPTLVSVEFLHAPYYRTD